MENKTIYFMGNSYCGKTAIINRYLNDLVIDEYIPTLEDVWTKNVEIRGKEVRLRLVEIGGSEESQCIKYDHILQASTIVYVISVTDRVSYESAYDEIVKIIDHFDKNNSKTLPRTYIVANKIDDVEHRVVSSDDLLKLQLLLNGLSFTTILETSIADFDTIETLFMMLATPNRHKTSLSKELIEVHRNNSFEMMKKSEEKMDEIINQNAKVPKQHSFRSLFNFKKFVKN